MDHRPTSQSLIDADKAAALNRLCIRVTCGHALKYPPQHPLMLKLLIQLGGEAGALSDLIDDLTCVELSHMRLDVAMQTLVDKLDALGFADPQACVNGSDVVDVLNELLPTMRHALRISASLKSQAPTPAGADPVAT